MRSATLKSLREPPALQSLWDLPIHEIPFAFVDLEMTGLDVEHDRVVEICIERVVGGEHVGGITSLVRPSERIGGASHIHGLDDAALTGAPSFDALAGSVVEALDGAIVVAHAAEWDVRFLEAELARAGLHQMLSPFLDTLVLSRRAFALPSHSLEALCSHFAINRGRAHRAADDVRCLRAVFERCVATLAPVSARDLWEVRIAEKQARTVILEACAEAIVRGTPVVVTYRPHRRPAQDLLMVMTGVRSDLDPPRALGYQLPDRSRRELRADRILRIEDPPSLAALIDTHPPPPMQQH